MKKYGLIGCPVAHSKSPELFRKFCDYEYDLIEESDFEKAYEIFLSGYDAVNVTAPFKTKAFEKADIKSPECEAARAANILVKTPSGVKACNSDYSAVCLLLLELMKTHRLSTAIVVGCGGAGRAAVIAALEMGLKTTIANRTVSKAREFADSLGDIFGKKKIPSVIGLDGIFEADIVIYTLPCDISPVIKAEVIIEANYLDPCLASSGDAEYIGGEKWLELQAETGFAVMIEAKNV